MIYRSNLGALFQLFQEGISRSHHLEYHNYMQPISISMSLYHYGTLGLSHGQGLYLGESLLLSLPINPLTILLTLIQSYTGCLLRRKKRMAKW